MPIPQHELKLADAQLELIRIQVEIARATVDALRAEKALIIAHRNHATMCSSAIDSLTAHTDACHTKCIHERAKQRDHAASAVIMVQHMSIERKSMTDDADNAIDLVNDLVKQAHSLFGPIELASVGGSSPKHESPAFADPPTPTHPLAPVSPLPHTRSGGAVPADGSYGLGLLTPPSARALHNILQDIVPDNTPNPQEEEPDVTSPASAPRDSDSESANQVVDADASSTYDEGVDAAATQPTSGHDPRVGDAHPRLSPVRTPTPPPARGVPPLRHDVSLPTTPTLQHPTPPGACRPSLMSLDSSAIAAVLSAAVTAAASAVAGRHPPSPPGPPLAQRDVLTDVPITLSAPTPPPTRDAQLLDAVVLVSGLHPPLQTPQSSAASVSVREADADGADEGNVNRTVRVGTSAATPPTVQHPVVRMPTPLHSHDFAEVRLGDSIGHGWSSPWGRVGASDARPSMGR